MLSILIFGLLLPLALAYFTKATSGWMFMWSAMIAVAGIYWTTSFDHYSTYQPQLYWQAIPCSLIMISIGTIVRLWWKTPTERGPVNCAFVSLSMALLFAVLYQGVSTPREAYWRSQCKNNLKQIGLAMHNYYDVYARFPPANHGGPAASWRVTLLPFVEQQELAKRYDFTRAWDSVENPPLQSQVVPAYDCPSRPTRVDSSGHFLTAYVVPTMAGSLFDGAQGPQFKDITDGTSNTIMAVESCSMSIVWSEPRDADLQHADISINGPGAVKGQSGSFISSWHVGGAQVLRV
ncbi:MAG TPA: DUF1559 domain-containing protein [Planctomycetaceae bacterium]|nr:DUF1559 domain-containing protein [Planctomycetaceae bacterium]